MTFRTMSATIESLRVILREVDQVTGAGRDSGDLAELRRILVQRIAELELDQSSSGEAPDRAVDGRLQTRKLKHAKLSWRKWSGLYIGEYRVFLTHAQPSPGNHTNGEECKVSTRGYTRA